MSPDFKAIIKDYNAILFKIGRSYTNTEEDFQDLYQEILIQLWQALKNFQSKAKLSTFIYRVALNTAITYRTRKKKKQLTQSIDEQLISSAKITDDSSSTPEDQSAKVQLLYRCINMLKKDDRAVILLHLEGQSYEEIAEITGITANNVGVKLNRIKKKLYQLLQTYGYARI